MTEFNRILDRIDISSIAAYFLYGSEPTAAVTTSYEERISASYKEVYTKLEALFPTADKTDESLQDIISDLALAHSDVYLQVGVLIGFQLYKVLEREYHSPKAEGIDKLIKKYIAAAIAAPEGQEENGSVLERFFEKRSCPSLEKALAENDRYQKALEECTRETGKLEQCDLNKEQKAAVDRIIAATGVIGAEYGAASYRQGFQDARNLVKELLQ